MTNLAALAAAPNDAVCEQRAKDSGDQVTRGINEVRYTVRGESVPADTPTASLENAVAEMHVQNIAKAAERETDDEEGEGGDHDDIMEVSRAVLG